MARINSHNRSQSSTSTQCIAKSYSKMAKNYNENDARNIIDLQRFMNKWRHHLQMENMKICTHLYSVSNNYYYRPLTAELKLDASKDQLIAYMKTHNYSTAQAKELYDHTFDCEEMFEERWFRVAANKRSRY